MKTGKRRDLRAEEVGEEATTLLGFAVSYYKTISLMSKLNKTIEAVNKERETFQINHVKELHEKNWVLTSWQGIGVVAGVAVAILMIDDLLRVGWV